MTVTKYIATRNTPGFLPDSDTPPAEWDTPAEAWDFLASERRREEDDSEPADSAYSETVDKLDAYAAAGHGEGTVYGCEPGNPAVDVAYTVTKVTVEPGDDKWETGEPDLAGDGTPGTWSDNGTGVTL